jgi:hypothetical protein
MLLAGKKKVCICIPQLKNNQVYIIHIYNSSVAHGGQLLPLLHGGAQQTTLIPIKALL